MRESLQNVQALQPVTLLQAGDCTYSAVQHCNGIPTDELETISPLPLALWAKRIRTITDDDCIATDMKRTPAKLRVLQLAAQPVMVLHVWSEAVMDHPETDKGRVVNATPSDLV